MNVTHVRLTLRNDRGIPGLTDAPHHLVARTFEGSLKGKSVRSASVCTFQRDDDAPVRWLGAFVHMDRGGVRFVPGMTAEPCRVQQHQDDRVVRDEKIRVNHITLDPPDWKTWHITAMDGDTRMSGFRTRDLGDGRKLWCGLSVPGPAVFPSVHKRTRVTVKVDDLPRSEVKRRWTRFKDDVLDNPHPACTMHPEHRRPFGPSELFYITLVVGPRGSENYGVSDDPWLTPYRTTGVEGPPEWGSSPKPDARTHRVTLGEVDCQVTLSRIPGRQSSDMAITLPA